ncbi:MAG: Xaa-Pro peptidase family protein [Planctomycetota bacterium]|nr:Xaa-Pro peptidase family protein [Planctomycetota bacterium]
MSRGLRGHLLAALALLVASSAAATALSGAGIGAEEHGRRREALARSLGKGVIALIDEPISRRRVEDVDDNTPKYDFFYLTGWEAKGSIFLMRLDTGEAALFVKGKKKQAKARSGIESVLPRKAFPKTLREWVAKSGAPIWTKMASRGREDAWTARLRELAPRADLRQVGDHLVRLRLIKSSAEMETIRRVAEIGAAGLRRVIPRIRPGIREGDIARAIEEHYFKKGKAQRLSFPSIVGSGANGTIIHYVKNASVMKAGEIVVIDVGAELDHYASDISRTIPVSGRFTRRQRQVYEAVLDAQMAAEKVLKPGATLRQLHEVADQVIRERGFPAIPHFVGHFVGLSVHDSGVGDTVFKPGMVVTIEPGIYLRGEGIGVRIEDMYLVTEAGYERLSGGVPRTVDEIEGLVRGKTPAPRTTGGEGKGPFWQDPFTGVQSSCFHDRRPQTPASSLTGRASLLPWPGLCIPPGRERKQASTPEEIGRNTGFEVAGWQIPHPPRPRCL